jgi:hypothetical protein
MLAQILISVLISNSADGCWGNGHDPIGCDLEEMQVIAGAGDGNSRLWVVYPAQDQTACHCDTDDECARLCGGEY